jgi:hypothetical protein
VTGVRARKTVAELRGEVDQHRRWYPSNALGTAEEAVAALEGLIVAEPSEVFVILDELRGATR